MTPYLYRWQEISIGTYLTDDWQEISIGTYLAGIREEQDHGEPPEVERR
jgi:hypothetical protein